MFKKFEDAKEMNMFKCLRKSVEIGANGTQKVLWLRWQEQR